MGIAITAAGNGYSAPELALPHVNAHPRTEAQGKEATDEARRAAVDIRSATSELERVSLAFNKKLRFEVNRELNEVIVKVIDPNTDKVIKELPPEELQRLHLKIKEMIGLLFDERA